MNKNTVDVSIVTANYNNGKYLSDFIESVLDSSVLPKELIIVDDGSTDCSLDILRKYEHVDLIKVIKFEKNRGFANALNEGLARASGEYIMRVDPDDILDKDRIEMQSVYLDQHKDIDVLGSNVIYFNSQTGEEVNQSNFPISHENIKKCYFKGEHGIQHPTAIVRSEIFKKYEYRQESVPAEDFEIFARMIKDGHRFANIQAPLLKMRIHGRSSSSNLEYNTIKKTFNLRDSIFGTSTSRWRIFFYYLHILNYRKYLISKNIFRRALYIFLAVLFYPQKLWRRLKV